MSKIVGINHVAILVDNLEEALLFWRDTLALPSSYVEEIPEEQARAVFLSLGNSHIELIEPTTEASGMSRYLAKSGPGLHHLCLEVDDIDGMLELLKSRGVRLVHEEPLSNLDGKRYLFIHPQAAYGVLVELYELPH